MRPAPLRLALLMLLVAGCGHGAKEFSGSAPTSIEVYGQCAFCHNDVAAPMTEFGGHGSLNLKCESCHDDLTPGMVGCGHRSIPRCPECHTDKVTHHDPAVAAPQQCTICHTPHGSPNINLVRTQVPLSNPMNMTQACRADGECAVDQSCAVPDAPCGTPVNTGGCAAPITFTNLQGRADGSFASASDPGTGICEVCHTTTRHYRSDGTGEPHFTTACYPCHPHNRGFTPQ